MEVARLPHAPNKGRQMVRYFGYYSNVAQGKRKKGRAMRCGFIPPLKPESSYEAPGIAFSSLTVDLFVDYIESYLKGEEPL